MGGTCWAVSVEASPGGSTEIVGWGSGCLLRKVHSPSREPERNRPELLSPLEHVWETLFLGKGQCSLKTSASSSGFQLGICSRRAMGRPSLSHQASDPRMTGFRHLETLPFSGCFPSNIPSRGDKATFEDLHWFQMRWLRRPEVQNLPEIWTLLLPHWL